MVAEGEIDDDSFIQGIQNLIKQGLITISVTEAGSSSSEIPPWVKNNAKWWAEGEISESDFLKGIEYLVSTGVITVD